MSEPELENWGEIEKLLGSDLQQSRDIAIGKSLQNVTLGIVNGRHSLSALRGSISNIGEQIIELNENLKKAAESSTKLTKALNNITFAGVIIAGLGILIAGGNLVLDILQFIKTPQ